MVPNSQPYSQSTESITSSLPQKADAIINTLSKYHNNATKNDFSNSWLEWTAKVSHQKPELPEVPSDALKYRQYIINLHGWWPIFGGEPSRKRKISPSNPSFRISPISKQNRSTPSPFPKRRKIHNSSHFSSPFSCKNYLAIEWLPDQNLPCTATPPRTTTSALPQENFAAVTSRVLLVRRLKAKQGNLIRGDAASRFRKSILMKVANGVKQVPLSAGQSSVVEPRSPGIVIDSPGDVVIKKPWKDGTTEPSTGNFKELQKLREDRNNPELEWISDPAKKLQNARDEISIAITQVTI